MPTNSNLAISSIGSHTLTPDKHMQDDSRRRIATIARHLQPLESPSKEAAQPADIQLHATQQLATQHTAAKREATKESSYAKVHGQVSEEPASWTGIPAVQKTALQEVIYQKAVREGIAKVSIYDHFFCLLLGSKRC